MVHEQKFKDLLSSTCQISSERIVLDLESEVMRGPGSIPTGSNIFLWIILFSHSKASAANIGIIAILVHFEKTLFTLKKSIHNNHNIARNADIITSTYSLIVRTHFFCTAGNAFIWVLRYLKGEEHNFLTVMTILILINRWNFHFSAKKVVPKIAIKSIHPWRYK